nr:MAG TPA: hypothetical protein [Bacteriophage sp.]DAT92647.1 MAG TPA: hypothetical protein [Caudoviricetes sp.]
MVLFYFGSKGLYLYSIFCLLSTLCRISTFNGC